MPILVIHNLLAVGMHHWGPKEFVVGAGYYLKHEEDNSFERNATAIFDGPKQKAYIKRHDAQTVSSVFKVISSSNWLLKPKEILVVLGLRIGPQQRCSIGCRAGEDSVFQQAVKLLNSLNVAYEIKH